MMLAIFLSWHLGKSKYNLDNKDFISWIGLIESIPQMWKREIKLFSLHLAESCSPCSQVENISYRI